jgi:excisionase family DNA binding protein
MPSDIPENLDAPADSTPAATGWASAPPVTAITYVQNFTTDSPTLDQPLLTVDVDRLLKYREVAYLLGIPTARVYALSDAGDLPSVMLPGTRSRRWRLSDVQVYLRSLPAYPVDASASDRRRPPTSRTA